MHPDAQHEVVTAAQVAEILRLTVPAVKYHLRGVPPLTRPGGPRGQRVHCWPVSSLPPELRGPLTAALAQRGCRTVADYLQAAPKPWTPPQPFRSLPPAVRERGTTLADAFAALLASQHQLSPADYLDRARVAYRQHFGHTVADDRLRYLLDRATKRDNGFGHWHDPSLYLDDADFRATEATAPGAVPGARPHLDEALRELENAAAPTLDDRAHLWHAVFRDYSADGSPVAGELRTRKQALLEALNRAVPALYRPQNGVANAAPERPLLALRRTWNRLFDRWINGGRTVDSIRAALKGHVGRDAYRCSGCEKKLHDLAARSRGIEGRKPNMGLAFTLMGQKRLWCPACAEHWASRKLSAFWRERCTPNVIAVASLKGADAVRKVAPTYHCDWRSDTEPGDVFCIDDMTTNEMAWDEVDGEIISGQTQLLFTEDAFSGYPLPFFLYFGAPNSRTIKKALWQVFTGIGLPHGELQTERGVFNNRQLAGERGGRDEFPWRELKVRLADLFRFNEPDEAELEALRSRELGLRDPALGLQISQARSPQAKTVERSFFEFQKRASLLPGFSGFQQRAERPKRLADFDRRVKDGKEHPGNEYLHIRELAKNYTAILEEIKDRKIYGMRHRGRTPFEMWSEEINRRPLRRLPPEIEHLFARRRIPNLTVHGDGIHIDLDRFTRGFYFNGITGPLTDRKVTVYVNYDIPEHIHIEHPDTGLILKVERVCTKRRTATPEEIAKASRARREHISGARGVFGNIEHQALSWVIRDNAYTDADKERGRVMGKNDQAQVEQRAATEPELRKAARLCEEMGMPLPDASRIKDLPGMIRSLEQRRARLEQHSRETANAGKENEA